MAITVYQIVNMRNGKSYVGISRRSAIERFEKHWSIRGKGHHLHAALRKYARIWWSVVTLAEARSWDEACEMEREEIAKRRTNDRRFGYNLTTGGEGVCGLITPRKPQVRSAAARESVRKSRLGRKASPETLRRMSQVAKGRRKTPEQIERSAKFHRGRTRTEETKAAMAQSRARWWVTAKAENRLPKTSTNHERDTAIALAFWETRSKRAAGVPFGITENAVHAALRRVTARIIESLKVASPMFDHLEVGRGTTLIDPSWLDLAA